MKLSYHYEKETDTDRGGTRASVYIALDVCIGCVHMGADPPRHGQIHNKIPLQLCGCGRYNLCLKY